MGVFDKPKKIWRSWFPKQKQEEKSPEERWIISAPSKSSKRRSRKKSKKDPSSVSRPKPKPASGLDPILKELIKMRQEAERKEAAMKQKQKPTSEPGGSKGEGSGVGSVSLTEDSDDFLYRTLVREPRDIKDPTFQERVTSVMLDNKYDRKLPKRRKGRLDGKNLWRAEAGYQNVFTQKQERKNKNYHVVLLIDCSGSMRELVWDDKGNGEQIMVVALETAFFMAQALDKLGVETTIMYFNCRVEVAKRKNEPLDIESLKAKFREIFSYPWTSGNHDYEAIETAYKQFVGDKYGKILMVFSDGRPSCGKSTECWEDRIEQGYLDKGADVEALAEQTAINEDPRRIKRLVQSHREVTTVGIGIGSDTVSKIYPQYTIVESMDEFKPAVLGLLKRNITRM